MALRKEINTATGVPATVWDVIRVEWNKQGGQTLVALYGWTDGEAMDAGRQPIDTRLLSMSFPIFPYLSDVYDKVKESRMVNGVETNEFAGATRT